MSKSFGHKITALPDRGSEFNRHCLAGTRTKCDGKPAYVLVYSYYQRQPSKHGVKEYEISRRMPACLEHTRKFAKKHKLAMPGGAR